MNSETDSSNVSPYKHDHEDYSSEEKENYHNNNSIEQSDIIRLQFTDFMNNSDTYPGSNIDDQKLMQCFLEYVKDVTDVSTDFFGCPVKFDGISCWPKTHPSTIRAIPCFEELNGLKYNSSQNATLYCNENGVWADKSSYHLCVPLDPEVIMISSDKNIKLVLYIGYSMSLVAVLFALWIFLSLKDLRCLRNTIHANLLATYVLHNLFWIASASLPNQLGVFLSCSCFVAVNYTTLTNFMWMFVEGLYLYMLVVKTFSVENIKLRIYLLIGWGVSVLIIIAWVTARLQMSSVDPLSEVESDLDGTCSLYMEHILDWIVRIPVLFVLTINILFLARIMWVLITKLRSANNVETQRYWKATKALLVLIPLLGLAYMLLIALPQKFEFFRAVLLSTQGFWVAIFYCFLNSEVRNSIRHHFERWRTERGIAHSRGASIRHFKDSSPKTRAERFSHYGRRFFGCKRESLVCSEVTTMTTFVTNGYNSQTTSSVPQCTSNSQSAAASLQVSSSHPRSCSQPSLALHTMSGGYQSNAQLSASTALLSSTDSQELGIRDAAL